MPQEPSKTGKCQPLVSHDTQRAFACGNLPLRICRQDAVTPVDGLPMTALLTRLLKYFKINSLVSSSLNPSICSRVSQFIRNLNSVLCSAVETTRHFARKLSIYSLYLTKLSNAPFPGKPLAYLNAPWWGPSTCRILPRKGMGRLGIIERLLFCVTDWYQVLQNSPTKKKV